MKIMNKKLIRAIALMLAAVAAVPAWGMVRQAGQVGRQLIKEVLPGAKAALGAQQFGSVRGVYPTQGTLGRELRVQEQPFKESISAEEGQAIAEKQTGYGDATYEPMVQEGEGLAPTGFVDAPGEQPLPVQEAQKVSEPVSPKDRDLMTEIFEGDPELKNAFNTFVQENEDRLGLDLDEDPVMAYQAFLKNYKNELAEKSKIIEDLKAQAAKPEVVKVVEKEVVLVPEAPSRTGEFLEKAERVKGGLQQLRQEKEKLTNQLAVAEERRQDTANQLEQANAAIAGLRNRLADALKPAQPETTEKEIQSRGAMEKSEEVKALEAQIAGLVRDVEGMKKENATQGATIVELTDTLTKKDAELTSAKEAVEKVGAKGIVGEALKGAEVKAADAELETAKADIATRTKELQDARGALKSAQDVLAATKKDAEVSKGMADALQGKIKQQDDAIVQLTNKIKSLEAAAQKAEQEGVQGVVGETLKGLEVKAADAELKTTKADFETLTKKFEDTQTALKKAKADLETTQQDATQSKGLAEALKGKIDTLTAEVNTLTGQNKAAQDALNKAQEDARTQEVARAEQEKKDQAVEQAQAKATQDLVKQIDELKAEIAKIEKEKTDALASFQAKMTSASTEEKNKLNQEFAQKESVYANSLVDLGKEKSALEASVASLTQELSKKQGNVAVLESKLTGITQENSELSNAMKTLQVEHEGALAFVRGEAQKKIDAADAQVKAAQTALEELEKNVQIKDQAYAQEKTTLEDAVRKAQKERDDVNDKAVKDLDALREKHTNELKELNKKADADKDVLKEEHKKELGAKDGTHAAAMEALKDTHAKEIQGALSALTEQHEGAMEAREAELKNQFDEQIKKALGEQESRLRTEFAEKNTEAVEAAEMALAEQKTLLNKTHEGQMDEFMRQMDEMKAGHTAELAEAQKANDVLVKENSGLKKGSDGLRQKNKNLAKEAKGLAKDVERLAKEKIGVEKINDALGKQNDALGKEYERVKTENEGFKKAAESWKEEYGKSREYRGLPQDGPGQPGDRVPKISKSKVPWSDDEDDKDDVVVSPREILIPSTFIPEQQTQSVQPAIQPQTQGQGAGAPGVTSPGSSGSTPGAAGQPSSGASQYGQPSGSGTQQGGAGETPEFSPAAPSSPYGYPSTSPFQEPSQDQPSPGAFEGFEPTLPDFEFGIEQGDGGGKPGSVSTLVEDRKRKYKDLSEEEIEALEAEEALEKESAQSEKGEAQEESAEAEKKIIGTQEVEEKVEPAQAKKGTSQKVAPVQSKEGEAQEVEPTQVEGGQALEEGPVPQE